MALAAILEDGTLFWHCPSPKCRYNPNSHVVPTFTPLRVHVSDPMVQVVDAGHVNLPYCPDCGARTMLRINHDEEERGAPNSITYGYIEEVKTMPHAETGEPFPVRIPVYQPVGANPAITRHQDLLELLKKHGKYPYGDDEKKEEDPNSASQE